MYALSLHIESTNSMINNRSFFPYTVQPAGPSEVVQPLRPWPYHSFMTLFFLSNMKLIMAAYPVQHQHELVAALLRWQGPAFSEPLKAVLGGTELSGCTLIASQCISISVFVKIMIMLKRNRIRSYDYFNTEAAHRSIQYTFTCQHDYCVSVDYINFY